MPSQKVLIVGAGVSGSILAHSLAQHDFEITVIERSKVAQKLGQGIEIEQPAIQVIEHMGLLETLESVKTAETGFKLCDEHDRARATFGMGAGVTGNLELMRGDLTEVLYKAADKFPNVTYHFETTIQDITQSEKSATALLTNRSTGATQSLFFDYIIGADGSNSKTRALAFGAPEDINCFHPVGAFVAFFSIPKAETDTEISRACHFTNRRIVWFRPQQPGSKDISVHFVHVGDHEEMRLANASGDRARQKAAITEIYGDLGWETPRALAQMQTATNFYSDTLRQVKLPSWSKGRVALVGDSAWAPTPFTGEGNQLAIMGAWVLGQEMVRHRSLQAFSAFEARFRARVEEGQSIPLNGYGKYLFCPEKRWSIFVLRSILATVAVGVKFFLWTGFGKLLSRIFESGGRFEKFDMQMPKDGMEKQSKK